MVPGIPGMLLSLKEQGDALKATELPDTPLINVLPADDPFSTAHRASRTRYFTDQKLQRQVFNSSGVAKPTILVNGQIVGVWTLQEDNGQQEIRWKLLTEVDTAIHPLIHDELQEIGTFLKPDTKIIRE